MIKTAERIKFADLYDQFPKKWVVTTNADIVNGKIDTCEFHAAYDTEDEGYDGMDIAFAEGFHCVGLDWMIKEEDQLETTIIATPFV
ncbi:MAG: hypothetical protein FWG68_07730 [Defluviitaleaceae bacterium]|nr:hypothetical protein [Defluviitaleaceae bacterium]